MHSSVCLGGAPTGLKRILCLAGSLVRRHPHQTLALTAQRRMTVRVCLGHLRSQPLSNPGCLNLLLLRMQTALMQSILLLDRTQAMVQSTTIRMLVAIMHRTCIRQQCSNQLQLRMTGACLRIQAQLV